MFGLVVRQNPAGPMIRVSAFVVVVVCVCVCVCVCVRALKDFSGGLKNKNNKSLM